MKDKFTHKRIKFAYKVAELFIQEKVKWTAPRELVESLFVIDLNLKVTDISFERSLVSVSPCLARYCEIMHETHVTLHNHPIGRIYPSDGDWSFAKWLKTFGRCHCAFHMITNPAHTQFCMYQYGKGVLIL